MRDRWQTKALGELCDILDNKRKPITKQDRVFGEFPYYGASGILGYVDGYIFNETLVLIGEDGAKWGAGENTAFAAEGKYWVNNHAHVIRPHKDKLIDEWLIYFLNFNDLSAFITGLTVPKLNQARMREIPIPLPPLREQKRIVAILDEAFQGIGAAIANAEKNLANARELFASEFQLVINKRGQNWEEISLGELAETSLGKMLDKQKNKGELKPYLRNLNVRWFEFDLNDLQEMRFEGDETERYSIRKGDVVICEGGYPGRAAVWESDETVFFQKALHRVRFKHPSLSKWLTYLLYLADMRGELKHHFTGTGIQHFTGESLKRFKVLAPPLTQLPDITNKIDKLFHQCKFLEAIYQEKITAFAKLKQSLLARAFSGELATVGPAMEQPNVPVESFATPERVADIIAFAQQRHKPSDREATYGRVKAQKTLHLIESMGGIDLGRQPMKDAAGPNDFQHMLNAEEWAKQHQFFKFVKRPAGGYDFKKLSRYGQMMSRASETLKPVESTLKRIVDILVPMDTDGAELLATVHAAWNNLILNGAEITEDAIVREARDDWHPDKLKIAEHKFRDMIKFIRNNGHIPDGSAKRVIGEANLF